MAFAAVLALIFVLGLSGRRPTRGTYLVIGLAAAAASAWDYLA
jgi:hypothetical protein